MVILKILSKKPSPKLKGFYYHENIPPEKSFEASSIKGFSRFCKPVKSLSRLPRIDLYINGTVAVDRMGNRIGKGAGYGDREDEILSQAGLIDSKNPRVVLVYEVQVFENFSYLMEEKDKGITIIVTLENVYRIKENQ